MTDTIRTHPVDSAIEHFHRKLPGLIPLVSRAVPWSLRYGIAQAVCSHPNAAEETWFQPNGHSAFAEAELPIGFCFVGLHNHGGREYLIAMWDEQGRRFWFYNDHVPKANDSSTEEIGDALDDCLARWRQGDRRVLHSGPAGGWVDGNVSADGIGYL